jgi:hypothetical protein
MSPRARATLSLFGGWNSARGGAMHVPRPTFHSVASAASRCRSVEGGGQTGRQRRPCRPGRPGWGRAADVAGTPRFLSFSGIRDSGLLCGHRCCRRTAACQSAWPPRAGTLGARRDSRGGHSRCRRDGCQRRTVGVR